MLPNRKNSKGYILTNKILFMEILFIDISDAKEWIYKYILLMFPRASLFPSL